MQTIFIIFLLGLVQFAGAVEPIAPPAVEVPSAQTSAPRAWLGLKVAKPDETITAHVPALPPGVGFIVKSVDAGGPAAVAGIRELDLIWKIGDQMLVNEAQLATLLRLSQPDAEITLSGFRAGKALEVRVKLGNAPLRRAPDASELVESAILTGESSGPMRIVNVAEKSASFTAEDGTAVVQLEEKTYHVTIHDPDEKLVFKGDFSRQDDFGKAPETWHKRLCALRRGLDRTLEGGIITPRQPRPRVVPPAAEVP